MKVAVAGGGIAGTSAAWHLHHRGASVVLFESSDALGGRTRCHRGKHGILDTGAGFLCSFYPQLHAALKPLGLRKQLVQLSRTTGIRGDGQLATMTLGSVSSFLRFPFLGVRDKARFAAEMGSWTLQRPRFDLHDPHNLAHFDDEDMITAARRRVSDAIIDAGMRPGVEPFYFFRCEAASVAMLKALCSRIVDGSVAGLRTGMDSMCTAMAQHAEVRLNTPVAAIEREGAGVRVNGERFDALVLAWWAPELLGMLPEGTLDPAQQQFLAATQRLPQVHVAWLVDMHWPHDMATVLPIGGRDDIAVISRQTPKHGRRDDGRELVSVFLTAEASEAMVRRPDDEIAPAVWQRARRFWSALPAKAQLVGVYARPAAVGVPYPGFYKRAAAFLDAMRPPIVFAGDHLTTPNMEGAFRTGKLAAERVS